MKKILAIFFLILFVTILRSEHIAGPVLEVNPSFATSNTVFESIENATLTLLSDLQYPKGLWVKEDHVYLTETAGHNTVWGGRVSLDRYNITSGLNTVLIDDPQCSDAVVVAVDNKIYLTSPVGSIPGEDGRVSVVDPTTIIETHLLDIDVASEDMFIDSDDDMLIIGSSDQPDAKSIYLLSHENYTNPIVLKTGLGRTWCISRYEEYTYFADHYAIKRFSSTNGTIETFVDKSVMSMTIGSGYLYYADYFGGNIGRINMLSRSDEVLLSGLHDPINIRYDASSNRLYFLEVGTEEAEFKDGTLKVIDLSSLFNATIESCNSIGERRDVFELGETVFVNGSGFSPSTGYSFYIVVDQEIWTDGMPIPERVPDTETSIPSNVDGEIDPIDVWHNPQTVGNYDIVVDVNDNGQYDAGVDVLDDGDVEVTAGISVITEFSSILLLFMTATLLAVIIYRRKHTI